MRFRSNRGLPTRSRLTPLTWLLLFLALVCLSSTAIAVPTTPTAPLPAIHHLQGHYSGSGLMPEPNNFLNQTPS